MGGSALNIYMQWSSLQEIRESEEGRRLIVYQLWGYHLKPSSSLLSDFSGEYLDNCLSCVWISCSDEELHLQTEISSLGKCHWHWHISWNVWVSAHIQRNGILHFNALPQRYRQHLNARQKSGRQISLHWLHSEARGCSDKVQGLLCGAGLAPGAACLPWPTCHQYSGHLFLYLPSQVNRM